MQFYDYIYRNSIVHKLDPRTKIAWLVGLSFLVFLTNSKKSILCMLGLVLLIVFLSKLPLRNVWQSSKVFIIFFTIANVILFSLLLWSVKQGVIDGIFFSIKFLVLIISSIVFAMSTSPRDLMLSLTKMKVPYELAFMLTLAIRFVPVIAREINHVIDAQKARAHKIKFSLMHPIDSMETFLPILIPTFHLLLMKAFDLSLSIEARAFRSKKERTYPPRLKLRTYDYISLIILIGISVYVTGGLR